MENQTKPEVQEVEEYEDNNYYESTFDSCISDSFDDNNMMPTTQDFADAFGF